jgi:hypothetical protein
MAGTLSGSYKAMRLTPMFAINTGWMPHFPSLAGLLGFRSEYPGFKDFVRAVQLWQSKHPAVHADGIIGPRTWKVMEPLVKAYAGDKPRGSYPDWFLGLSNEIVAAGLRVAETQSRRALVALAQRGGPPLPPCSAGSGEDDVIKEMARVAVQQRGDPDHPIAVSAGYARHASRLSLKSITVESALGFSSVRRLAVGQVWPGVQGGTRIVLALQDAFDLRSQAMSCEIVFVTDSGRIYTQPLRGWAHDYATVLIDDVNRQLAPLKVMLDVEAAFLIGGLSAVHPGLGAVSLASSILAWWGNPRNRELMAMLISGFGVLMAARDELRKLAPTLYDKVWDAAVSRVLGAIPAAAVRDKRALATFVGQLLWTFGRAAITRDFGRGAEGLQVILRWVWKIVQPLLGVATATTGLVVAAVPGALVGAGKQTGRDLVGQAELMVREFKEAGFIVATHDAIAMLREIQQSPQRLDPVLRRLKATLDRLMRVVVDVK